MNALEAGLTPAVALPDDADAAMLVGRVWVPHVGGPAVVVVRGGELFDVSSHAPTITHLINSADPLSALQGGSSLGSLTDVLANSAHDRRRPDMPWLLAPVDLAPVKASGVTFATSLLERVIEEQAGGDRDRAHEIRTEITELIGTDLAAIAPGSAAAESLKQRLIEQGAWSPYLEVGIGPDAEVFTKAAPLSSVGTGSQVGILQVSEWNNPEPELALFANASGHIVGVSLGNDVNLRDIEGRSALLLGKAKDNNAACSIGPFLRLFDDEFTLDDARDAVVGLQVFGDDGFTMDGESSIGLISRDLEDLMAQTIGPDHHYPDGVVLLSGTMFAPTDDREEEGQGFTHHRGDVVRISSPRLGSLVNEVNYAHLVDPWDFGIASLMSNLSDRGLI